MSKKIESRKFILSHQTEIVEHTLSHTKSETAKFFNIWPTSVDSALYEAGFPDKCSQSYKARREGKRSLGLRSRIKKTKTLEQTQMDFWSQLINILQVEDTGKVLGEALEHIFESMTQLKLEISNLKSQVEGNIQTISSQQIRIDELESHLGKSRVAVRQLQELNKRSILMKAEKAFCTPGD